jgi:membrane-associated phospholipid phosphatase
MLERPRSAALAALACFAGLALTGLLAYLVPLAHARDSASLSGFVGLGNERRNAFLSHIAHMADPAPYGLLAASVVALALARRRRLPAAALAVVLLGAPLTTEALKHALEHPRIAEWLGASQIGAASWPSGHATASMSIALCGVVAAPPVLRPLAGVAGGLFAVGVSFSILVLHWHFPSDIVGGYLCAATWTLAAVAVVRTLEPRTGERDGPRGYSAAAALPAVGLALAAGLAVVAVAADRPRRLASYLADHPSFTLAAGAIVALAVLLAAVLVALSRETR